MTDSLGNADLKFVKIIPGMGWGPQEGIKVLYANTIGKFLKYGPNLLRRAMWSMALLLDLL